MDTTRIFTILIIVLLAAANCAYAEVQAISVNQMDDKMTVTVLGNGDMQVNEKISLSAASFEQFKAQYPTLSMFARIFEPKNTPTQIENLDIDIDDMKNSIDASYVVRGASVNKGNNWELLIAQEGQKLTLSAENGNTIILTSSSEANGFKEVTTSTVTFPSEARNVKFDGTTNKITYELPYSSGFGAAIFLIMGFVFFGMAVVNHLLKY